MSAGQYKKHGVKPASSRVAFEDKLDRWLRCVERPKPDSPRFENWIKKCPHCLEHNPGIRLHCKKCRTRWEG